MPYEATVADHLQGGAQTARIPGHQPARQGPRHSRRRVHAVRIDGHPALPRSKVPATRRCSVGPRRRPGGSCGRRWSWSTISSPRSTAWPCPSIRGRSPVRSTPSRPRRWRCTRNWRRWRRCWRHTVTVSGRRYRVGGRLHGGCVRAAPAARRRKGIRPAAGARFPAAGRPVSPAGGVDGPDGGACPATTARTPHTGDSPDLQRGECALSRPPSPPTVRAVDEVDSEPRSRRR